MSPVRSLFFTAIVLLLTFHVHEASGAARAAGERVYGKVIDSKTKKPVDYASVSVLAAGRDSLIAGVLTEANGDFSFENITPGSYRIKITFIGYQTYEKPFSLTSAAPDIDLGNISISTDAEKLTEVTVTGEKAAMTMTVDKKVFNVEKDISSRGGNALDVMKNIPGVSVDADGNVALRNNTPLIYIDGKPTSLTLDQIPSDEIERVEVITNASAKYEAAASGGVLNVVMKHNQKPGYNGLVSVLGGTNAQWNGTAMINIHRKKLGVLVSFNSSGTTNPTKGYNNRTTLDPATSTPLSHYDQNTLRTNKRAFETIRTGIDYYISNRNTLSLTENIVIGRNRNDIDATVRNLDATGTEVSHGNNYNYEGVRRRTSTTTLDYHHGYPKQGKEYTISLNYEFFHSLTDFLDTANTYNSSGDLLPGTAGFFKQSIPSGVRSHMVTAQWDFQHPLRDSIRLEYGLRSYYKRTTTYAYLSDYIDSLDVFRSNPQLSSHYQTDELINAAYLTVGQQVRGGFSYQVGMRFEQVYFAGKLLNKNRSFSYSYPSTPSRVYESFFPSFYLSERISEHHLVQLNGTRKTNRPRGGQIDPNIEVIDQRNYTSGNPSLQPEFINQGELNYNLTVSKFDWLTSAYLRYTEHPITGYTTRYDSTGSILLATYLNGKGQLTYGWENTMKINPTRSLGINLSGNIFYTSIQTFPDASGRAFTNSGLSWTAKAMINYKFPLGFAAQINGSYEAPKIVPQGRTTAVYYFDISLSKEFSFVTLNLTVSDVLNSKAHGLEYVTPEFIQSSSRRREVRYAKLGAVFKFGKDDKADRQSRKIKKDVKEKEEED